VTTWSPNSRGLSGLTNPATNALVGDSTSAATAINDRGQVVGISGACGIAFGGVSAAHSVLWQNNCNREEHEPLDFVRCGVVVNIGDLGGHTWNTPTAINNEGTVVGFSLPAGQDGTRNFEAFLWTQEGGIQRLGELPGDIRAEALGVNERNQVVGLSRGGPHQFRAFIWQNGVMSDLNNMTTPGSEFLLYANDINNRGEITGQAFDPITLAAPAFLGIPVHGGEGAAAKAVVNGIEIATLPDKVLTGKTVPR
jgi:probable HAF family extracellular repeat protein